MASPYSVALKIQYPSGTNLNNVNVTVRNEATNESKTLATNSSGEVMFNLGQASQFPSGWAVGHIFSYIVSYTAFEFSGSHTIVSGKATFTRTVVLISVPTAPSLRLFKPQEFLDFFNLKIYEDDQANGIKMQQLVRIGEGVELGIENNVDTKFDSTYTFTELIDTNGHDDIYLISKIPILSLTTVATTQNDEGTTPDYDNNIAEWTSLTDGTDYTYNAETGRLQITNGSYMPITRKNGLYVAGTYGRTTVPVDIKTLAILETGLMMLGASFIKATLPEFADVDTKNLTWFKNYRTAVLGHYMSDGVGTLNT
ncbi:hypothetical protein LCGC14_1565790 [marine sediment metagenome]|uniref:Uncharacterized protein n=1 Tax=marine sediment metagenome TaxID=412755 RepID=A0A0F9LLP6_9ZZZZ